MIELITNSSTELNQLKINNLHSISKINWWLLKYGDLFKRIEKAYYKSCKTCIELQKESLPYDCILRPNYCNKTPEYSSFIKFYNELDELTQIHKLEYQCLLANDVYLFYDFHQLDINEWITNYKEIYQKLYLFYIEHLNWNSSENFNYLTSPDNTFEIVLNKSEFREIIEFYNYYEEYLIKNA